MDVKKKNAVLRVGAAKSRRKEIREGSMLWSSIKNNKGHKKINEKFKKSLYNWILQHSQVVRSQLSNDYLKVSIVVQYEPQLVPKVLLQVSAWEIYNIMVSPPE